MGKYKILIFPTAIQDLQDIVDYLNSLAPEAALKLYDDIIVGISKLEQMPMRCPLAKSTLLQAKGYRVIRVHSYLVFFLVNDSTVEIRRILYARRQYEHLL